MPRHSVRCWGPRHSCAEDKHVLLAWSSQAYDSIATPNFKQSDDVPRQAVHRERQGLVRDLGASWTQNGHSRKAPLKGCGAEGWMDQRAKSFRKRVPGRRNST